MFNNHKNTIKDHNRLFPMCSFNVFLWFIKNKFSNDWKQLIMGEAMVRGFKIYVTETEKLNYHE